MLIIGGLRVILEDTDIRFKLVFYQDNFRHVRYLIWEKTQKVTLSEPRPYKNILKKEGSIYSKKGGELYTWPYLHLHQLFKFWIMLTKIT